MKRIVAILMAAAMLFAMTSCGTTADGDATLIGKWQAQIDYAGVINAFVAGNEVLAASGETLEAAPLTMTYEFKDDGTLACSFDKEELNDAMMVLFEDILTPMLSVMGAGMTLEEYITRSGMSTEELLVSLFTEEVYTGVQNAVGFSGTYTMNADKLSVTVGGHTTMMKTVLDGDTLTLTAPLATGALSAEVLTALKGLYPLELKKVG